MGHARTQDSTGHRTSWSSSPVTSRDTKLASARFPPFGKPPDGDRHDADEERIWGNPTFQNGIRNGLISTCPGCHFFVNLRPTHTHIHTRARFLISRVEPMACNMSQQPPTWLIPAPARRSTNFRIAHRTVGGEEAHRVEKRNSDIAC